MSGTTPACSQARKTIRWPRHRNITSSRMSSTNEVADLTDRSKIGRAPAVGPVAGDQRTVPRTKARPSPQPTLRISAPSSAGGQGCDRIPPPSPNARVAYSKNKGRFERLRREKARSYGAAPSQDTAHRKSGLGCCRDSSIAGNQARASGRPSIDYDTGRTPSSTPFRRPSGPVINENNPALQPRRSPGHGTIGQRLGRPRRKENWCEPEAIDLAPGEQSLG